jgi:crotonobetainyl-CoA:carnitine CoA-transferase CaiB-like acyl-CoA transferase
MSAAASAPGGPLAAVTVLDFTTSLSGPLGAGILADLGADVIKVERPGAVDRARAAGTVNGDISSMFHMGNRGKRSIELDLAGPGDRAIALELAAQVDVVVENFRPGVTDRLGIDYDSLSAINPDLIYVSVTGFGPHGPYARRPAFDSVIQAYGGLAAVQGRANPSGAPELVNHALVDKLAGLIAAQSTLAALYARERGRGGQRIDVAMLEVAAWFTWLDAAGSSTLLDAPAGQAEDATSGKRVVLRYTDGWGMISLGHDDSFRSVCEVFGVDPAAHPQLVKVAGRDANPQEYQAVLDQIAERAATMTRSEASAQLDAVGAIFGEVLEPSELPANEQLRASGLFLESLHPTAGRIIEPRLPATYSVTVPSRPGPSPNIDEHGRQIRAQLKSGARVEAELASERPS